jgi:pimeloyl-ACP methyl ester carboxylesterase
LRALAGRRDRRGPEDAAASDRPVLLLSGSNDPITPPEYARAATLAHATQPSAGTMAHGQIAVGCVPRLFQFPRASRAAARRRLPAG